MVTTTQRRIDSSVVASRSKKLNEQRGFGVVLGRGADRVPVAVALLHTTVCIRGARSAKWDGRRRCRWSRLLKTWYGGFDEQISTWIEVQLMFLIIVKRARRCVLCAGEENGHL